jgi:hypothetical protein
MQIRGDDPMSVATAIRRLKVKALLTVALIALTGLTLAFLGRADPGTQQPIAFPHKTHIALGLACTMCHQRADKDSVAGRPPTAFCLGCHAAGETNSEQIKKLRRYGDSGQEVPWKRVWRLPGHVFFPHQVHVTAAQLACQTCHGPIETLTSPPPAPLKEITMDECISCHDRQRSATRADHKRGQTTKAAVGPGSADCIVCHR